MHKVVYKIKARLKFSPNNKLCTNSYANVNVNANANAVLNVPSELNLMLPS